MSRNTAFRRGAAVIGASGLIALSLAGPAAARPDPGTGELHERSSATVVDVPTVTRVTQVLRIDDNAVEYLQLGAGVAAGLALGGAGMLLVSRRTQGRAPSPAQSRIHPTTA